MEKNRIEELDKAVLTMSPGKSPGLDGNTEFYRFFWNDMRIMLFKAFLECILTRKHSNTMKQGIITLIP